MKQKTALIAWTCGVVAIMVAFGIRLTVNRDVSIASTSPSQEHLAGAAVNARATAKTRPKTGDISIAEAEGIAEDMLRKLDFPNNKAIKTLCVKSPTQSRNNIWRLLYDGESSVEIDARSKRIVNIQNNVAYAPQRKQAPTLTDPSQARERALTLVHDLGLSFDPNVKVWEATPYPSDKDKINYWTVMWRRAFNGIPYENDAIVVQVDAVTGALLGYGYNYASLEPRNSAIKLDEGRARDVASCFLSSTKQGTVGSNAKGTLWVVNPSYELTSKHVSDPMSRSDIAWRFEFDGGYILIGASDGEVLGGGLKNGVYF